MSAELLNGADETLAMRCGLEDDVLPRL